MKNNINNFTTERIAELRKNIDFSDIPELTAEDFARGYFKYRKPIKKPNDIPEETTTKKIDKKI